MKKQLKSACLIIISGILIVLLACSTEERNIENNLEEANKQEKTENFSATEDSTRADVILENSREIYFMEDDSVKDFPIFLTFLDNEIPAYDINDQTDKYYYEYYEEDQTSITGVHIMTEDLNGDAIEELLINIMYGNSGVLIVIHEKDGQLYQWDVYNNFFAIGTSGSNPVKLYSNGIIEWTCTIGSQRRLERYNDEGHIETELQWYRINTYYDEEVGIVVTEYVLEYYENEGQEISLNFLFDEHRQIVSDNKEEIESIEANILNGAEQIRTFLPVEREEGVTTILLEDIIRN